MKKIYLTRICRNHSPGRLLPAGKRPAQARSQRRRQRNRQHRRQGTHPRGAQKNRLSQCLQSGNLRLHRWQGRRQTYQHFISQGHQGKH